MSGTNLKAVPQTDKATTWQTLFAALAGIFIAIGLLKFGNPVILAAKIDPPRGIDEWIHNAWPLEWAYLVLLPLVFVGLKAGRWKKPHPILLLPVIWLVWQFISATQTVSFELTAMTLPHFTACVVCLFLGWYALAEAENPILTWAGIVVGFAWIIRGGLEQHFGGLEAARKYFELYVLPTLTEPPPELIKKMATNRVFSTLFYPNTFAGAILFFLPVSLVALWQLTHKLALVAKLLIAGVFSAAALACLFWSGSKSGWLLMLVVGGAALVHAPIGRNLKRIFVAVFIMIGVVGFFAKYAGFFEKGATSVTARMDYWRAAGQTFAQNPFVGTGPGTFSIPYQAIKPPEAEMARLCHNDYLEQASDSGIIGFIAYTGMLLSFLIYSYRYRGKNGRAVMFALWLGLAAVNLQSLTEFNLYIPALAYPNFLLMGYLLAPSKSATIDTI